MLAAPAEWLIQVVAVLPTPLRPGVVLAIIIAGLWFVLVRRGLPSLWHRTCRGAAIVMNVTIGVALFPEYLLTTARRKRGAAPGALTHAVGAIAEAGLAAAASLYKAHLPTPKAPSAPKAAGTSAAPAKAAGLTPAPQPVRRRRFPWAWCAITIVVFAAAVIVMEQLSPQEQAKQTLAEVFEYWRDIEAWANVNAADRAAPGDPVTPRILSVTYHTRYAHIALYCPEGDACAGVLTVRNESGRALGTRTATLEPEIKEVISLPITAVPPTRLRQLHLDIYRP
jgi:hypothetical protein